MKFKIEFKHTFSFPYIYPDPTQHLIYLQFITILLFFSMHYSYPFLQLS